jgi:topoisomerase-4 subunit A
LLVFPLAELKLQPKGGRGLTLIDLDAQDALVSVCAFDKMLRVLGSGRGGKAKDESFGLVALAGHRGARARKGKAADFGFRPTLLLRG